MAGTGASGCPWLSKHIAYRRLADLVVLELSDEEGVVYAQVDGVVYRAVLMVDDTYDDRARISNLFKAPRPELY
jgi:hypothetical protein